MKKTTKERTKLPEKYAFSVNDQTNEVDEQKIMEAFAIIFSEVFTRLGKDATKLTKLFNKHE